MSNGKDRSFLDEKVEVQADVYENWGVVTDIWRDEPGQGWTNPDTGEESLYIHIVTPRIGRFGAPLSFDPEIRVRDTDSPQGAKSRVMKQFVVASKKSVGPDGEEIALTVEKKLGEMLGAVIKIRETKREFRRTDEHGKETSGEFTDRAILKRYYHPEDPVFDINDVTTYPARAIAMVLNEMRDTFKMDDETFAQRIKNTEDDLGVDLSFMGVDTGVPAGSPATETVDEIMALAQDQALIDLAPFLTTVEQLAAAIAKQKGISKQAAEKVAELILGKAGDE